MMREGVLGGKVQCDGNIASEVKREVDAEFLFYSPITRFKQWWFNGVSALDDVWMFLSTLLPI